MQRLHQPRRAHEQIENRRLKTSSAYRQRRLSLAFSTSKPAINQGIGIGEAASLITPLLNQPVPGIESRRFEVLPETIAPVVSLSQEPFMKAGMYMIADMGAGTTEMAVFHVSKGGTASRFYVTPIRRS